jgi:hypothetical protein
VFKIPGAALIILILLFPSQGHTAGVKTSYKQYSVFTYENEDILCEPYQVKKDDWLYKIFRQKGEISEADFPRFLNIFKKINPRISNIDAIAPGINILIPLKKIDTQDYEQKTPGIVEVPVIEFSSVPEKFELQPFVRKHTIQTGDTVTKLLDKEFFVKGGAISQEAKKTFLHLNPNVTNIDLIYKGTQLVIPDPSILAQPWFNSFLKQGSSGSPILQIPVETTADARLPVISRQQMTQLKRYSELIQGTLIHQGTMHFPGGASHPNIVLDLTQTPLIESKDGEKTVIVPRDDAGSSLGAELVENIRAYWKQIKVQQLDHAISMAEELERDQTSLNDRPVDTGKFIATLLSVTQTPYVPEEMISFFVGTIEMKASFGRITRQDQPDLLINTGSVYGLALESIEKKGNQILTLPSGLTMSELILTLFTRLGYSLWENPSFTSSGRVETIRGIYAKKDTEELLFTRQKPSTAAISFLEAENIQFLILTQ